VKEFLLMIVAYVLVVLLTPFVVLFKSFKQKDKKAYFLDVAIGFDQAGGSVVYQTEDWTISSWTYFLCSTHQKNCKIMKFIDLLFGKEHCKKSFLKEARGGLR